MEEILEQFLHYLEMLLVYLGEIGPEVIEAKNIKQFLVGVQ